MSRYTLTFEPDGAYDLGVALTALEILVPENDNCSILVGADVAQVASHFFSACHWDRKDAQGRPSIMPGGQFVDSEADDWAEAARWLHLAAMCINDYLSRVEQEKGKPT